MAGQGDTTRHLLLDAALGEFARHGVDNASLLEITRRAGQRNRGAVHYHFGSRTGLLVALLEDQSDYLAEREGELLRVALERPEPDLAAAVEAVVRPAVELCETGWRGRCYLRIVADIVERHPDAIHPDVSAALARTGGAAVFEVIAARMPELPADLRDERLALATGFLLQAIAGRAPGTIGSPPGRPPLATERFVAHLVLLVSRMLSSPDLPEA